MCRNITTLRGLEPPATSEEIEAAARQYVRKVTGVQSLSDATRQPFEDAVRQVAALTARLRLEGPAHQAGDAVRRDRGQRQEAGLGAVQADVLVQRPGRSVGELHAA